MTKEETWNGTRHFPVPGRWFEVLSAPTTIDVRAYAADGRVLCDEKGVTTGYSIDRRGIMVDRQGRLSQPEPFARIEIDTPSSQTIEFVITDGASGYRGSSDVSDRAGRVLGTLAGSAHTQTNHTVGAVSAPLKAALSTRKYLAIQNQSATEDIYVRTDGGAAAANNTSFRIGPGQTWEPTVPPTGQINAIRGAAADAAVNVIEA